MVMRSQLKIITYFQQTVGEGYGHSILLFPSEDTVTIPATQYLQPDNLLAIFKASPQYERSQNLRVAASFRSL
ncbi:MAG: hypothetical protein F6K03_03970 [Kamptonema sp. SIO4C4]|nr:hypothetical protein [Kamptonema sp. SIO4C4]